jgi:hypothetical protein
VIDALDAAIDPSVGLDRTTEKARLPLVNPLFVMGTEMVLLSGSVGSQVKVPLVAV